MNKCFTLMITLFVALMVTAAFAETDYMASEWVDAIKNGEVGKTFGKDGVIKNLRTSGIPYTSYGIGSLAAVGGLTVTEYGDGLSHQTVIVASDVPIIMDEAGTGTNGVGSTKIYDFPAGRILVEGVVVENFLLSVDTNALDDADGGDFAFGTAAGGGASGLAALEVNLCPSTSIDAVTNIVDAALAASAQFDGTTTAVDIYVNTEIDDGDIAAGCTNTADFTITITWKNLGDY